MQIVATALRKAILLGNSEKSDGVTVTFNGMASVVVALLFRLVTGDLLDKCGEKT